MKEDRVQMMDDGFACEAQGAGRQNLSSVNPQLSTLNSQRGFTLIELLIVTVVIVALMGIMFRLTGLVGSTSERQRTIERMQRLENCLSGYYAAFGQYPPVPLQGSSYNIFRKVCESHHIQCKGEEENPNTQHKFWLMVEAACRAQPVAAIFPPAGKLPSGSDASNWNEMDDSDTLLQNYADAARTFLSGMQWDDNAKRKLNAWGGSSINYQQLATNQKKYFEGTSNFTEFQMFRFGLMSFLLPRYLFMLECAKPGGPFYETIDKCKQWTAYNVLPAHIDTGVSFESWGDPGNTKTIFTELLGQTGRNPYSSAAKRWEVDLVPSQAACARWLPNLEGIVSGPYFKFFGVEIGGKSNSGFNFNFNDERDIPYPFSFGEHDESSCGSSSVYTLNTLTVQDGWYYDFYYYSPPPYQSYILWSSGANAKTFPPWIDMNEFKSKYGNKKVQGKYMDKLAREWAQDDIIFMGTGER